MYLSRFFMMVSVVCLFISWVAYLHPEIFMKYERARRWIKYIGEDWTKRVIRCFSVPLVVLICVVIIGRGILHEVMIWNAHHGDAGAQYKLADHFEHGNFQDKDLMKAIKWYRRSAENGYSMARVRIADIEARVEGWGEK